MVHKINKGKGKDRRQMAKAKGQPKDSGSARKRMPDAEWKTRGTKKACKLGNSSIGRTAGEAGTWTHDLGHLAARDTHELMRCWELAHRTWVGEAHMRHMLHRKETRWPGYYYRADYPDLDDVNWRVFVNSRYDPNRDHWELNTKPYLKLFT